MNWRERLDARIDTCPECDWWRWDRLCKRCTQSVDNMLSVVPPNPDAVPTTKERAA